MESAKVVENMVLALKADTALINALGSPYIYKNRSRKTIQIPGIYWTIVSAVFEQNEAPVVLQWDVFAESADKMFQIEARLIAVMHSDIPKSFNSGAFTALSMYKDRQDHEDDDQGVHHSSIDFEYRPIREDRYSGP